MTYNIRLLLLLQMMTFVGYYIFILSIVNIKCLIVLKKLEDEGRRRSKVTTTLKRVIHTLERIDERDC